MTFQVSDFEGAAVGSDPGDYSGFTENDGPTGVTDVDPVQGSKSYRFKDNGSGVTGVTHPVGDETVIFAIDINRDAPLVGGARAIDIAAMSGGNRLYYWEFADDGSGPFEIHFSTDPTGDANVQNGTLNNKVAETSVGFHDIEVRNPATNLQLVIDGAIVHDTGQAFTGADTFRWDTDDMDVRIDSSVGFSQFVYHSGKRVVLGGGVQNYVVEGGENGENLISDRGDSDYWYISGRGVGFDQS